MFEEKSISSERRYTGCIINVRMDDIVTPDGKEHIREVIEHPGGVVIVATTEDNKIILVKQWRHPIATELVELPAGKLSPGEDPFEAAKREFEEETGFVAQEWESLGFIYTTPGFCNEVLHFYKASNLIKTQQNLDYGENIEPFTVTIDEIKTMLKNSEITDAKTIVGLTKILV